MRPEIDRARFADDVHAWMTERGLSTRSAAAQFPGLNPAMLSRARTEQILSAASFVALCVTMGKDPANYLIFTSQPQRNQAVTVIEKRETQGRQ